jgi:hypothetical protein
MTFAQKPIPLLGNVKDSIMEGGMVQETEEPTRRCGGVLAIALT